MGLDGIMVEHKHKHNTIKCANRPHTQEEDSERVICIMGTQTHIATLTERNIRYILTRAMYVSRLLAVMAEE